MMNKRLLKIFLSLFLLTISVSYAYSSSSPWFTRDAHNNVSITVDLFISSTCPHCHKADAYFRDIEKKQPWITVHRYVINQDKSALQTFYEHLQQQHTNDFSVPAILFCNSHWTGFAEENTTGKTLLRAMSYCHQKIVQQGELSPATINALQKWGAASQVQIGSTISQSAWSLIPLTAFSDGFNPCSLFSWAAFLALMWLYPEKKGLQLSIGVLYIVSLGIIHYLQQAHSGFFYQNPLIWRATAILAGISLLIAVFRVYRKAAGYETSYACSWIFPVIMLLVFTLHIYQQTCAFNLALVFDQWLIEQPIAPITRHFYLIIYQIFYLLPLVSLLLLFLFTVRSDKFRRYQSTLNASAYLILSCIGIILLAYPAWLANSWISTIVFFGSIGAGWGWRRYEQIK